MSDQIRSLEKALSLSGARRPTGLAKALEDLGQAPREFSSLLSRFCSDLGENLARHGHLDELSALIERGWALALFPTERWGDPFDAIAARGDRGYECLELLAAAGVKFFGGRVPYQGPSPLCSAAKRLDARALDYFLKKMEAQGVGSERELSERGRLAAQALADAPQRALLAPMILAAPAAWARSVDERQNGALRTALDKGLLDLASRMLEADPEAVKLAVVGRCAFSSAPLKALDLLIRHGADASQRCGFGATPLHWAMHAPKASKGLAAKLIALGANPRSLDEHGCTPIGSAMSTWSWSDIRDRLGATSKDLMDSTGKSSTQGVGIVPSLILALGQVHFGPAAKAQVDHDARLAEIIMAASEDSRASDPKFIEMGLMACADHGLPQCLKAFADIGARHGVLLRSKLLSPAVDGLPMFENQEAGRRACLKLALDMGVDLGEPYPSPRRWDEGKKTTLIEQALDGAVSNSDPGSQYFEPMARKAIFLAELGCDPSKARNDSTEWSFDPQGIGRSGLNKRTQLAFSAIDALVEAKALRASASGAKSRKILKQQESSPARKRGARGRI